MICVANENIQRYFVLLSDCFVLNYVLLMKIHDGILCCFVIENKLLNKLSQFLLCTKWIDKSLFDCCGLHHSKIATGRQEHLPDWRVSPFGNNPARQKSGGIASNKLRVWSLTQSSSSRGSDVNLVCRGVCWSGTVQRWPPNGDA